MTEGLEEVFKIQTVMDFRIQLPSLSRICEFGFEASISISSQNVHSEILVLLKFEFHLEALTLDLNIQLSIAKRCHFFQEVKISNT